MTIVAWESNGSVTLTSFSQQAIDIYGFTALAEWAVDDGVPYGLYEEGELPLIDGEPSRNPADYVFDDGYGTDAPLGG